MRLRRTRTWLAAVIALVAFVLALIPLLMWRSERATAVRAELDTELVGLMERVQQGFIAGEPETDFDAWQVNSIDEWSDPLAAEVYLEPPLLTWMRETGEYPSFRDYAVDDAGFRAYVLPVREGDGFVTLLGSDDRDDRLGRLDLRTLLIALAVLAVSGAAGWTIAGLALRPTQRAIAGQQGFLADAAHEMRTPLAVILASSSQALARPRSDEEYVRSLSEIRSAAERASAGVNELLDLVRFDSGQAIPRLAPLRLDLLAEEVAASVRADDCEVIAEPTSAVVVQADMPLLRQALDNLVRNAVRRSTRVELSTTRDGRDGVVTVADDGPGFDPALLDTVFDRYQRGDRMGDVGIGLAIVKSIVTAHGGTVRAKNAGNGDGPSGAIVEVRIPLDHELAT